MPCLKKKYNPLIKESIETYAKQLEGKTFREVLGEPEGYKINYLNKGDMGHIAEKHYFGYDINSRKEADFKDAHVELKVVPLKKVNPKTSSELVRERKGLSVKERIVITMINYMDLINETWVDNTLMDKTSNVLMMFYINEPNIANLDKRFDLVKMWSPSENDLKIIKSDWEKIALKVKQGKAHELSEGDTLYLGACTKGSDSSQLRNQPCSNILAKQRAFSLKRNFVESLYENFLRTKDYQVSLLSKGGQTIEDSINKVFSPYIGKTAYEIQKMLGLTFYNPPKNYYSILANKIMGVENENDVEEIDKAGLTLKSIRLTQNGTPKEDISFPAFKFTEIVNETWDTSELKIMLEESNFLFVVYRINYSPVSKFDKLNSDEKSKYVTLEKVMLWNMQQSDIDIHVKSMWEKTVDIINHGIKVWFKGNTRKNNLPSSTENPVAHVRPHGRDSSDTYPLPNGGEFTKQCFWLNKKYIAKQIKRE